MFLADAVARTQEAEPVLIVDDDEGVTTVLREFLLGGRHAVTVAHSVAEAARFLRQTPVALVLLDLQLPDGDGLDLLRSLPGGVAVPDVIIVTGHATLDSAIAAVDAGAAGYVVKPIDLGRLGELVARVLERRRSARDGAHSQAREVEAAKLYAITRELATSLDVSRVLDLVIDKTIELLGCDAAALFRYEAARDGLTILRGRGQDPELTAKLVLRPGDGVIGRAFVEARPVWTADRLADPRVRYPGAEAASLVRAKAPRAYLAVPVLRRRGGVYGVLEGFFYAPHEFTEREIQMLSALADHAAIVIDNAELFESVQTQQIRLTQIFESTSDGILVADRTGIVTAANRRLAELFEVDADSIVGEDLGRLVARATDVVDGGDAVFRALVADPDRGGEGDLEQRRARRVLHWAARPTRDATGTTVGLTLTFRDVTDEREMARMKSDFVSFVTHQLRTPLAGIKWLLEVAAQPSGVPASTGDYIRDARESAERLVGLVNDLLDTSRLESGKLVVMAKPTDLLELTQSVLADVEGLVRERRHRVTVAADVISPIMVDPQLARQVVMNLVSNAIKYTLPGGEIQVRIVLDGHRVLWSIQDNGIGIPKDGLRRLFEKFSRADNVMRLETEGTGLGLYLVRLIVERLGGRIWCESEEGKGSTFFVMLPREGEEDHG